MSKATPYEEGNPDSDIVFLGEAPGRVELRFGKPLVGPSGEVFNDCLRVAGIPRSRAYILNVWPFQVWKDKKGNSEYFYPYHSPRNEEDLLWRSGKGFTEYGLEQAQETIERLQACSANVIVTLGQQAMDLALGIPWKIMKYRGSILEGRHDRVGGHEYLGQARKVIPTVHPAATLHGTYLWRHLIIADMNKAKMEMETAKLELPDRNLIIRPTFDAVLEYIQTCREQGIVATDLEVINHQVSCFSLSCHPMEAMTVPLTNDWGEDYWTLDEECQIWTAYAELMGDPKVQKINQNIIGFDAPFLLLQNDIHTKGFLGDTMIGQHIMYPDFPKGLDFICSVRTREPYYKDEGKMWKGFGGDIEQFWRYCGKDACTALEAWYDIAEEMTKGDFWQTYNMTAEMNDCLMFMTVCGLKVDQERLEETRKDIEQKIEEKIEELEKTADYVFNPNSPKQCKDYFYEHKGCHAYVNAQGSISTDDKAMSRIYRRYNLPEAKLVQEIRNLRKLKSTYLDVQLDSDGRLRCAWNPRGTWTGRLSSNETIFGTGLNLQNLDPRFLEFIVADPG